MRRTSGTILRLNEKKAIWGEAVARVLGHKEREFLDAYYENIGQQNAESVDSDNVDETVVKLCDELADQKN